MKLGHALVCLHGFHESVPEHRIPAFLHTCLQDWERSGQAVMQRGSSRQCQNSTLSIVRIKVVESSCRCRLRIFPIGPPTKTKADRERDLRLTEPGSLEPHQQADLALPHLVARDKDGPKLRDACAKLRLGSPRSW